MRIKENFPWSIQSPVIHLVQPSAAIPLEHEIVFRHSGASSNAIYALAAQEKDGRRHKVVPERGQGEKESNLSCGFISPPIHQVSEDSKRKKSCFYDLRNDRSMSIPTITKKADPTSKAVILRSKSMDGGSEMVKRKTSLDFEDILRDLGCVGSNTNESTKFSSKLPKVHRNIGQNDYSSTEANRNSVFNDISLDDQFDTEKTYFTPPVDVAPRKSFSEETFDKNRFNLIKERSKMLQMVNRKERTSSGGSSEDTSDIWSHLHPQARRRVSQMVDDLLLEIYGDHANDNRVARRRSCTGLVRSLTASQSHQDGEIALYEDVTSCNECTSGSETSRRSNLQRKSINELREVCWAVQADVKRLGCSLVKQLLRRDCLQTQRDFHCNWITAYLQANSRKRSEDTKTRFSVAPTPGDSGFTQWQSGMRMVARLPEGIPSQFRKTLWLNLAEKHLTSRGVEWDQVEEFCFNEFTNPDDEELGVQIVKDVHRTGCSLFCGVSGKNNQALLKRVLLAYARWNKAVGYCQGFNMLAALILQVMDKSEVDSVKVMIYLIEGVLPESYFANNLRGLSVDMAVFRDLLRIKLPTLSRHFDQLQCGDSKDAGTSYEPPLTNVFTMQWFLTLFCNCLPQDTVLRVWDLIFLEGNHILLCTALAIWSTLSDRILTVESADEFYCIMGVLTREMLEFGLMDANALIKAIVSFSLPELPELREKYLYNITPWTQSVSTVARRGLRLFYSDDDTDTEEDDEKIAIATAYGLFKSPKKKEGASGVTSPPRSLTCPDKEKIAMDISALTKQYRKLRERQKQAHVILTAACGSQGLVGPTTSPAMNHLLMGKFALVNNKGRRLGPPPGSIPPPSQSRTNTGEKQKITISGETLHWKDAVDAKKTNQKDSDDVEEALNLETSPSKFSSRRGSSSSSSSTSTELCDDPQKLSDSEDQSNSLSECYSLSYKSEPSTPLRKGQKKVHHPADSDSCKEEIEETSKHDKTDNLNASHLNPEIPEEGRLSVSPEEGRLSVSPEGGRLSVSPEEGKLSVSSDGELGEKRKLSFKIDREELRELDRKLSLKIVEIERRKSSAGIESEDLNSKVLFPFDRDYIQEADKSDRDTPSSIPDDRLCSTELASSFEEETILVPDLITTHKPLSYRMTSLEECDESKYNEDFDLDESTKKESFESNEEDLEFYDGRESPQENYEYDEIVSNKICTKFNFDDLFPDNKIENEEVNVQETLMSSSNKYGQREDYTPLPKIYHFEPYHESEPVDCLNSETPKNLVLYDFGNNIEQRVEHPNNVNNHMQIKNKSDYTLFNNIPSKDNILEEDNAIINSESDNVKSEALVVCSLSSCSLKYSQSQIVNNAEISKCDKQVLSHAQHKVNYGYKGIDNNSENEGPLKSTNYNVEPSVPDVVTSRDKTISSIREKYANFPTSSIDKIKDPPLNKYVIDFETSQFSKNLLSNSISECKAYDINPDQEVLYQNDRNNEEISNENNETVENESIVVTLDDLVHISRDDSCKRENEIENVSELNEKINPCLTTNNDDGGIVSSQTRDSFEDLNVEEFGNKSTTARRGSEVALSLILRENSQILTKIHQQSRRSSTISVDLKQINETYLKNNEDTQQRNHESLSIPSEMPLFHETTEQEEWEAHQSKCLRTDALNSTPTKCKKVLEPSDINQDTLNTSSPIGFKRPVALKLNRLQDRNISSEVDSLNQTFEEEQETPNVKESNKLSDSFSNETLPDVCKMNTNKTSVYEGSDQASTLTDHQNKYLPIISSQLNNLTTDITKGSTQKEYTNKGFADSYIHSKRTSVMSPTKEVDEISPLEVKSISRFENSFYNKKSLSSSPEFDHETKSTLNPSQVGSRCQTNSIISSADNTDTNEDILKELRYLDIKPEETLEYSSKRMNLSPHRSDSYLERKYKYTDNDFEFQDTVNNHQHGFSRYRQASFDYMPRSKVSESVHRKDYSDHKAVSIDTASLDKVKSDSHLDEKIKSLISSEIATEDDNSLYINSLKSHGRLLIEKGELSTSKDLGKEYPNMSEVKSDVRKLRDTFERSAYELKPSNTRESHLQSDLFPLKPRTFEPNKHEFEKRGKPLFKYKSEDYSRAASPSRYRFSSASPVRSRLDTSSDSPFSEHSTLNRTKSPSPTAYSSSQSAIRRESIARSSIQDYTYSNSKDYKRTRTESLDLQYNADRSVMSSRRSEPSEITSSEKSLEEKSPISPSSPLKFNPFPVRSSSRQPKELGVKLGLYLPPKSDKSPSKRLT